MNDPFDEIMERAEGEHDIALGALQEALSIMTASQVRMVLNYLDSEEEDTDE